MKKHISRNDLCYCGSGKKYKKCCILKGLPQNFERIVRTKEFIEGMARSNRLARKTLTHTASFLKPGITTKKLEEIAHNFMIENNAIPATLNYQGYPSSICTSINEVICHGIPENRELLEEDIINIDISCNLNGYFGDTSVTYNLGKAPSIAVKLIEVTSQCLDKGIEAVRPYGYIGDIGDAIEKHAHKHGFSVVEKFVGHGIGKNFHEDPQVPHFGVKGSGHKILPGMIFTIEPMINEGTIEVDILSDGWTALTKDRKLSAQFEHTLLITNNDVRILTKEEDDKPLIPPNQFDQYQ